MLIERQRFETAQILMIYAQWNVNEIFAPLLAIKYFFFLHAFQPRNRLTFPKMINFLPSNDPWWNKHEKLHPLAHIQHIRTTHILPTRFVSIKHKLHVVYKRCLLFFLCLTQHISYASIKKRKIYVILCH